MDTASAIKVTSKCAISVTPSTYDGTLEDCVNAYCTGVKKQLDNITKPIDKKVKEVAQAIIKNHLEKVWGEFLKEADQMSDKSGNKFSDLLKKYNCYEGLDLSLHFEDWSKQIVDKNFSTGKYLQEDGLLKDMKKAEKGLRKLIKKDEKKYSWFARNASKIKYPYKQSKFPVEKDGYCYVNSLYREHAIVYQKNSFEMGSDEKRRRIGDKYYDYKYEDQDLFQIFGLKKSSYKSRVPIVNSNNDKAFSDFGNDMDRFVDQDKTHTILDLVGPPNEDDHVLNLHFDTKKHHYYLMDDNEGFLEFKSFNEFKEEVQDYLAWKYIDPKEYVEYGYLFLEKR